MPPLRRLNLSSALLFSTMPPGVTVQQRSHQGGSHVAIEAGKVVVTTITRTIMPRSLRLQPYQNTLAREGQLEMYPEHILPPGTMLWAPLVFGGPFKSGKLTLCRIVFPDPKDHFAPGTIDLLNSFRHVVDQFDDEEYARVQVAEFQRLRDAARQI